MQYSGDNDSQDVFSIREQLAQCIIPRVSSDEYFDDENVRTRLHSYIRELGIGGVCVFAGDAVETAKMIQELQLVAQRSFRPPLLVSADFEYGVAMRLYGGTAFPHAMALGVADDVAMTERVANAIALEMKALGIHWNFAPVADVNNNKGNPIVNIRSFGEEPERVMRHVAAFIRGTQSAQILASAKHFPGHGDTQTDSHLSLPTLSFSKERLQSIELKPFVAALEAGVESVMVGHLAVPALDSSGVPASLSSKIMTDVLRHELGFTGLVVTDALDMKAITAHYSVQDAAVRAFAAGSDVLLLTPDAELALNALEQAVIDGRISLNKVHFSFSNVLAAKDWCGIVRLPNIWMPIILRKDEVVRIKRKPEDIPQISKQDQSLLALEATKPALRWFGQQELLQPLQKYSQIAGFALVAEKDVPYATNFFRYLGQNYQKDCDFAFVDEDISHEDLQELLSGTREAEAVVFAVFARPQAEAGSVQLSERFTEIARVLKNTKPSVAVLFGNPYLRETFPADAFLCAFSFAEPALGAAAFELVQTKR